MEIASLRGMDVRVQHRPNACRFEFQTHPMHRSWSSPRSVLPPLGSSSPFVSMADIPQTTVNVPIGRWVPRHNDENTLTETESIDTERNGEDMEGDHRGDTSEQSATDCLSRRPVLRHIPMMTLDCDYVMEAYIAANQYDRDPYWTCIWPSSQAIAAAVLDTAAQRATTGPPDGSQQPIRIDVRGQRVADFGAGLGLAGVAAGLAGAQEVVFLDREPLSLACCVANAELNGCADNILPVEFDWNAPVGALAHRFDCILVCDCLYEKFSVEPIARVLPQLLRETVDARIVLADPPNRAKANRDKFLGLMKVYGFEMTDEARVDVNEMVEGDPSADGSSLSSAERKRTEIVLIVLQRTAHSRAS